MNRVVFFELLSRETVAGPVDRKPQNGVLRYLYRIFSLHLASPVDAKHFVSLTKDRATNSCVKP